MSNAGCAGGGDGTVWIAFNGEIYNHRELRAGLEERGHRYRNESDTETIVHLYEEYGPQSVERLSGMFAYAIWDAGAQRLLLARDRLGIKPLYYALTADGSIYFASEIKGLLASGAVKPEVNPRALPDYLANHAPSGEETLYQGVRRLPAGHTLLWQDGKVQIRQYWNASFEPPGDESRMSEADYVARWYELFRDAVRSHLMADVPLGVFLSGGIDSSAIAAVMSEMTREPIKTFSVAFAEREANELEYARMVSKAYRTDHHEVMVSPEEYFAALPKLIWHEDEPIGHLASVPLYFVSKLAAGHVKVVLTGEGSDELLAGYYRYRKTVALLAAGRQYHRWTTEGMRRLVRRGIEQTVNGNLKRKLEHTFLFRPADIEHLYFDNFAVFPRAMQQRLLTAEAKERSATGDEVDPYANVRALYASSDARTLLNRLLYTDMKTYLHELLMKQDQMSMAASLESRVPFLDWALVEFTTRMPDSMKLRGWQTKYALRRAMRDALPEQILRRPKMGFPVPVGAWFRGKFRHVIDDCVLGERALARGLFAPEFLQRLVAEHQSGSRDHAQRLWALVNFELWLRQFIDGEGAAGSQGPLSATAAAAN
jgi:asparagine synthase (glutamine-hydrolysing)